MAIDPFPLTRPVFDHQFGISAIAEGQPILNRGSSYSAEIDLRRDLLKSRQVDCFAALPDSQASQLESVEYLLANSRSDHPASNLEIRPDSGAPLLCLGEQIQEDVVICRNDLSEGFPVIAGCVCFPAGWSIADKLNCSLAEVHRPVPAYESHLHSPALRLFRKLKVGRPVCRSNWGVRALPQLAQFPVDASQILAASTNVDASTVGDCMFRVEYQTLSRMPQKGDIVFTIHTVQTPLRELTASQRSVLLGVLQTCPQSTLKYKGIWPMRDALTDFLAKPCRSSS